MELENKIIDNLSQKIYNICERGVYMNHIYEAILTRINQKKYDAFSSSDFLDLNNYKNISKALEKMEDEKIIVRARRGIYFLNKYNKELGIYEAPSIRGIAEAIARQFNWIIIPSGNYALNIVGLSTQVPSKYVFVSSGPYNQYDVGKNQIIFKHSTSKEITNYSYKILIAIQVLKTLGKDNIDDMVKYKLKQFLTVEDKKELKEKRMNLTSWIYMKLIEILEA